jgi:hypothetical protein
MVAAEDMPAPVDEQPTRRRSKPAHVKRRRATVPKEETGERSVHNAARTKKAKEEMGESDEVISEEEIALLKVGDPIALSETNYLFSREQFTLLLLLNTSSWKAQAKASRIMSYKNSKCIRNFCSALVDCAA